MGFLAVIGAAVAGAFGAGAIAAGVAMVIGSVIVGAAVGALYAAVTGGNILKGLLYGAVGGAVVGAGAAAVVGASFATPGTVAGGYAAGTGQALGTAGAAGTATNTSILASGATAATKAGALFTASNVQAVGAVASLGSAFLHGGNQLDPDAQLAEAEKDRDLRRELSQANIEAAMGQAELGLEGTMARIASAEKIAKNELDFGKERFTKEFDESKYRYRDEKAEVEAGRKRFETGIKDASKYIRGNVKSVSLVETNKQRKNLPSPVWYQQPQQQPAQTNQPAPAAGQPGVPA